MAINGDIYRDGVNGLLENYVIDSLPRDYEGYKSMFKEATETRKMKERNQNGMMFGLDMSKVVKIMVQKDDNSFIEYSINNGIIVDATIISKEKTIEDKVKELRDNPDVQKVSKLINLAEDASVLRKMAESGYTSISDAIKDVVKNEPIKNDTAKVGKDELAQKAKDSARIMKLNDKMDEFAKVNREKIAEHLFDDNPNNANARPILDTIIESSENVIKNE